VNTRKGRKEAKFTPEKNSDAPPHNKGVNFCIGEPRPAKGTNPRKLKGEREKKKLELKDL